MWKLLERPGFEEGRNAPGPHIYLEMNTQSEKELDEKAASVGTWILDAMKKDAET
jgi:glutathione S-transferase